MLKPDLGRMRAAADNYDAAAHMPRPRGVGFADETQQSRPTPQEVIDAIVQAAKDRGTAGKQADTIRLLSDERIIGKGDLQNLNYLEMGIAAARGVARIRVTGGSGTGSLVGPRVMLTNNHVLANEKQAAGATAQFDVQDDADGQQLIRQDFQLDPEYFFVTFPDLDATLVGVKERSARGVALDLYPWFQLTEADRELQEGDAITIIQHPLGGTKQIGFRNNNLIRVPLPMPFVHYTTDTQPGSSGSPCFDDFWKLVALHHSGVPARDKDNNILTRDGRPFVEDRDRQDSIQWVANEGAKISAILAALQTADLRESHRPARALMFEKEPPNAVIVARNAALATPRDPIGSTAPTEFNVSNPSNPSKKSVSITVNVSEDEIQSVTISRGGAAPTVTTSSSTTQLTQQAPAETPPADDADETTAIDPSWTTRKGYDPDFLGVTVALPRLSEEQRKQSARVPDQYLAEGDDPYVFKYHHYSLAFNARRRIAWYSAANVDGTQMNHKFERGKDRWFYDPRLDDKKDPRFQMGEELYSGKNTDRGHITRYLDVMWGKDVKEARNATNDTFHFSNCALQLDEFNQGKERWQGIERYLLEEKARKEKRKLTIISGPVLRRNDPIYQNPKMDYRARIPASFWKVCVLVPEDQSRPLSVTAFVLDQDDITRLPGFEEAFDVKPTQVSMTRLEELTKLDFGNLKKFDHFQKKKDGSLETIEAVPLDRPEDIVF